MNRRGFLKTFGALAAAAVAGPTLAKLAPQEIDRLVSAMRTGVVENQTFYFTHPITINFDNLVIRGCRFIFNIPYSVSAPITIDAKFLLMDGCSIDYGRWDNDSAIFKIIPQDEDMTTTFQSVLDTAAASGGGIDLPEGTYYMAKP